MSVTFNSYDFLERSIEGVSALTIIIELTPLQCFSTAQALKGVSVNNCESLLNAK